MRRSASGGLPGRLPRAGCAVLVTALSGTAMSDGFYSPYTSVSSLGTAMAGSAAHATDLSTIFDNPAGLPHAARTHGWADGSVHVSQAIGVALPVVEVKDRGSTIASPGSGGVPVSTGGKSTQKVADPKPVGNLYAAYKPEDANWIVGLGVTFPFGQGFEFDDDGFSRYDTIRSELLTVNVAPTFAVRVNEFLSFGAGLDTQFTSAEVASAIPNTLAPGGPSPETDGRFEVEGDDISIGFNAGILIEDADRWRVGVHYRSGMSHTLEGTAKISGLGGPLAASNGKASVEADVNLPAILSLSGAYVLGDTTLLAGVTWFDWSSFDETRIKYSDGRPDVVEQNDYSDAIAIALGAEHRLSQHLTVRGGVRFSETPTSDTFRSTSFPEGDNLLVATGATFKPKRFPGSQIDIAAAYIFFESATVDLEQSVLSGPAAGTLRTRADAESSVYTLSVNLKMAF